MNETYQGFPLVMERAPGRRGSIRFTRETIVIRLPAGMSVERAMAELERRWPRMRRKMESIPAWLVVAPRSVSDGETIRVFDQTYRLRCVVRRPSAVQPNGDELIVRAQHPSLAKAALIRWIKSRVLEEATRQANGFAAQLGATFTRIEVRNYRSRLGCCGRKTLKFHWGIGLLPEPMFKTVVAHEVAHLKHAHHQKDFWDALTRLAPDAKEHHKLLRHVGDRLRF